MVVQSAVTDGEGLLLYIELFVGLEVVRFVFRVNKVTAVLLRETVF